jgi:hypothetical protein
MCHHSISIAEQNNRIHQVFWRNLTAESKFFIFVCPEDLWIIFLYCRWEICNLGQPHGHIIYLSLVFFYTVNRDLTFRPTTYTYFTFISRFFFLKKNIIYIHPSKELGLLHIEFRPLIIKLFHRFLFLCFSSLSLSPLIKVIIMSKYSI